MAIPQKKKSRKTSTVVIFMWASILISIVVCLWSNSISITQISSSSSSSIQDHPHVERPLFTRKRHVSLPLQLWYFPHMGHPWLEWMAAQHNLTWGACHFETSPLYAPWCPSPQKPLSRNSTTITGQHQQQQEPPPPYPPHSRVLAWTWKNPDHPPPPPDVAMKTSSSSRSNPKYVVVLRNPYHRLIDLYYDLIERSYDSTLLVGEQHGDDMKTTTTWDGPCRTPIRRLDEEYYTPVQLNAHLIRWLKKLRSHPCLYDCLLLPQYEYIHSYDKNQSKTLALVDHVLHYEQLHDEWEELARQYQLPSTMMALPSTATTTAARTNQLPHDQVGSTACRRQNNANNPSLFTEHDLSPTTLALIHHIYAMDFALGNYTKIPIKPYIWPTTRYYVPENTSTTSNSTIAANTNIKHPLPRLELIHISKTGGTMLELFVARFNITWGACHFEVPWKWRKGSDLRHCPVDSVRDVHFYTDFPLWHAPRYMLPHHLPFDPYDNLQDETLKQRPPHYFVVIRNPYQRLISLFYMNYGAVSRRNVTKCMDSPERFNLLLRQWFRLMIGSHSINPTRQPYDPDKLCHHACAFLPQTHFILPPDSLPPLSLRYGRRDMERILNMTMTAVLNRTSWTVHHVLHLEHLEEELTAMLKQDYPDYYRVLIESQQQQEQQQQEHLQQRKVGDDTGRHTKVVVNANRCNTTLSASDLDRETLKQVHSLYALDFVLGGYSMVQINRLQ